MRSQTTYLLINGILDNNHENNPDINSTKTYEPPIHKTGTRHKNAEQTHAT